MAVDMVRVVHKPSGRVCELPRTALPGLPDYDLTPYQKAADKAAESGGDPPDPGSRQYATEVVVPAPGTPAAATYAAPAAPTQNQEG